MSTAQKTLAGLLLAITIHGVMAADTSSHDEAIRKAVDYVRSLSTDCVLTDGYVCADRNSGPVSPMPDDRELPGEYLAAWAVAYRDFLRIDDLSDEQKDLRHYRVSFAAQGSDVVIDIRGLLLPRIEDGEPVGTLLAVFGRSTRYVISRRELQIVSRHFLR